MYVGMLNDGRKAAVRMVCSGDTAQKEERNNEAMILKELKHMNILDFLVTCYCAIYTISCYRTV